MGKKRKRRKPPKHYPILDAGDGREIAVPPLLKARIAAAAKQKGISEQQLLQQILASPEAKTFHDDSWWGAETLSPDELNEHSSRQRNRFNVLNRAKIRARGWFKDEKSLRDEWRAKVAPILAAMGQSEISEEDEALQWEQPWSEDLESEYAYTLMQSGFSSEIVYATVVVGVAIPNDYAPYLDPEVVQRYGLAGAEAVELKKWHPRCLPLAISLAHPILRHSVPVLIEELGYAKDVSEIVLEKFADRPIAFQLQAIKEFLLTFGGEDVRIYDTQKGEAVFGKFDRLILECIRLHVGRRTLKVGDAMKDNGKAGPLPFDELPSWLGDPVDTYLRLLEVERESAKNCEPDERGEILSRWNGMQVARLFEIPQGLYVALREATIQWVQGELLRRKEIKEWKEVFPTQPEIDLIRKHATLLELPEKMPFPNCMILYDHPVLIDLLEALVYAEADMSFVACYILGHHITKSSGTVFLFFDQGNGSACVASLMIRRKGEWRSRITFDNWILVSLLNWINEHQTVIEDRRPQSYKKRILAAQAELKMKKFPPPPYYTVYMDDKHIIDTGRKVHDSIFKRTVDWQYRWDVRGHWMARVKRGPLPMDNEVYEDLRAKRYKIFTTEPVDLETWQHLQRRGVEAKKVGEWMAVLVSWRQDYIKGPPDKPYVPAVRKSRKDPPDSPAPHS